MYRKSYYVNPWNNQEFKHLLTVDGDKTTFSQENVDPVGFLTTKNVYHAEISSIKTWKDRVVVRGVLRERHHWGKQTG